MFIIDLPYMSRFLNETIIKNAFDVIDTPHAQELLDGNINYISQSDAIEYIRKTENPKIYTSSENSIDWLETHIAFSSLPEYVRLFKNKGKFRDLLKTAYPDFHYKVFDLEQLDSLDISELSFPFVIKPTTGFFSLGVYRVDNAGQWQETKAKIKQEITQVSNLYPAAVLDLSSFIIEQCIQGQEYAVDVYFNEDGQPVILNILQHVFSCNADVSDRVYLTSKDVILENLNKFDDFLKMLSSRIKLINFPMHMEVRIDNDGNLMPIEINPMRFGGWCTTGDFTNYCFGFNSYECFFNDIKPDWQEILKDKDDYVYSLIVLNNSTGTAGHKINEFDYDSLLANFENPLEIRKINHKEFPLFGFLFTQTHKNNYGEIQNILESDLSEFIIE
ncbi:MAG: ATP-grasp domain-containing protein [Phycisphaerae bacterium]|nr:ATP-grasp domain-containing protein [Phycisphaerae bacterium]